MSTTGAFGRMLGQLLSHKDIGQRIVPIIPDEARTFGLDALFRRFGIYSSVGQLYEPVDAHMMLSYREAKDGQVLEEGICEAGSMASFIAAGSAYSSHGVPMIPMYIFYSMFGFQRTGDQIWAAGDQNCRGFLLGATAGRTTLNGEGLQHADGHSPLIASAHPHVVPYDPAFAYEIAVIIQDGLERMLHAEEAIIYYITLENETYPMPPMPPGVEQGILDGIYLYRPADKKKARYKAQLLGSGSILIRCLEAQRLLADEYDVAADVWSVTSYTKLRREALDCERDAMLHPSKAPRKPIVAQDPRRPGGPDRRRHRLRQVGPRPGRPLGARPLLAGDRRIRLLRHAPSLAQTLRGRRDLHHPGGPAAARPRWRPRSRCRDPRGGGTGGRPRKTRPYTLILDHLRGSSPNQPRRGRFWPPLAPPIETARRGHLEPFFGG